MVNKSEIKDIRALHQSKVRQEQGLFIAEGEKCCSDLIRQATFPLRNVYLTHEAVEAGVMMNLDISSKLRIISATQMEQISTLKTVSPCLCVFGQKETNIDEIPSFVNNILYLDRIQDPGNVGTIIRTADWFGVDMVIRSEDSADFFNPKVVISSMGSIGALQIATGGLQDVLKKLPGIAVTGTFMDGNNIFEFEFPERNLLILGSEGKGIRPEFEVLVNNRINIPGRRSRSADSLNVAVAAGITCALWLNR